MAQPDSIEDAIEQNAKGPKRVRVAKQSVERQSIDEQNKADRYLAAKNAAAKLQQGRGSSRSFRSVPDDRAHPRVERRRGRDDPCRVQAADSGGAGLAHAGGREDGLVKGWIGHRSDKLS